MNQRVNEILNSPSNKRLIHFLTTELNKPWSLDQINRIIEARGRCEYCGADVLSSVEAFWGSEWDHIVAKKHSGTTCYESNVALACSTCNMLKCADLPPKTTLGELITKQREAKIEEYKPLISERRREDKIVEIFAAFRELVDLTRCGTNE